MFLCLADINECEEQIHDCEKKTEDCLNIVGSYKCVARLKKKATLIQDEDYDAEDDNEDDDYDDEGGITESSDIDCDLGFKKDGSEECVGKLIHQCYIYSQMGNYLIYNYVFSMNFRYQRVR